jgi:hypothetical protein
MIEGQQESASVNMVESALSDFVGLGGGVSLFEDDDGFRLSSEVSIFPALPHNNLAKLLNLAPISIEDNVPVPIDTSFVVQFGLRLEMFLEGLKGTINRSAESNFFEEEFAVKVNRIYDVDLEELILNSLTGKICASFTYAPDSPTLGNPLNFLVELEDPDAFDPILRNLNNPRTGSGFLVPERERREYRGEWYYGDTKKFMEERESRLKRLYEKVGKEWDDPPVPEITQLILGDFFLSCNSEDELKKGIESYTSPEKSLNQDQSYLDLINELTKQRNDSPICAMAYFSNGDFLRYLVTRKLLQKKARAVRDMGQWYLDDEPNGYDQFADFLGNFPMDKTAKLLPRGIASMRINQESYAIHIRVVFLLDELNDN